MVSSSGHTRCSNEMEESPMTQPQAYQKRLQRAKQQRAQQAKQRCLQQARERLQREQARAQRALPGLGTGRAGTGPARGRGRGPAVAIAGAAETSGQDLRDDVSPRCLAAAATASCAGVAGRRTALAGSWEPCPSGSGSSNCNVKAKPSWSACGSMSKTKAQRRGVSGRGPGRK